MMTRKEENEVYKEGLKIAKKILFFKNTKENKEELAHIIAGKYLMAYSNYDETLGKKETFIQTILDNHLADVYKKNANKIFNNFEVPSEAILQTNIDEKYDYNLLKNKIDRKLKEKYVGEKYEMLYQFFINEIYNEKDKVEISRAKKWLAENLNKKEINYDFSNIKKELHKKIAQLYFIEKKETKEIALQLNYTRQHIQTIVKDLKTKIQNDSRTN